MIGMDEDEEYLHDQITGAYKKKKRMSILNKRDLSSFEMDELFLGEE